MPMSKRLSGIRHSWIGALALGMICLPWDTKPPASPRDFLVATTALRLAAFLASFCWRFLASRAIFFSFLPHHTVRQERSSVMISSLGEPQSGVAMPPLTYLISWTLSSHRTSCPTLPQARDQTTAPEAVTSCPTVCHLGLRSVRLEQEAGEVIRRQEEPVRTPGLAQEGL